MTSYINGYLTLAVSKRHVIVFRPFNKTIIINRSDTHIRTQSDIKNITIPLLSNHVLPSSVK